MIPTQPPQQRIDQTTVAQSTVVDQVLNTPELCELFLLHCDNLSLLRLQHTSHLFKSATAASIHLQRRLFLAPAPDKGPDYIFDSAERGVYTPSAFAARERDPTYVPDSIPRLTHTIKSVQINDLLLRYTVQQYKAPSTHLLNLCTTRPEFSCNFEMRLNETLELESSFNDVSSAMEMYLTQPPVTLATIHLPFDHSQVIELHYPDGLKFGDVWDAFGEHIRDTQAAGIKRDGEGGAWMSLRFNVELLPYRHVMVLTDEEERELQAQAMYPKVEQEEAGEEAAAGDE